MIDRFNFGWDYENTQIQGLLDNTDRRQYSFTSEFNLNEVFSIDLWYHKDIDGWVPYKHPYFGASVSGLSPYHKWGDMNQTLYGGLRIYPIDQWHSESLKIRHKKNTGFYFALGKQITQYEHKGFRLDVFSSYVTDSITNITYPILDSTFIHYAGFKVIQWGTQFGFGWKQFHSRYVYTDIGIFSNAYFRDNRIVTGWFVNDPDDSDPPYIQEEFDLGLDHIRTWARNGPGFVFRATIAINLDIEI